MLSEVAEFQHQKSPKEEITGQGCGELLAKFSVQERFRSGVRMSVRHCFQVCIMWGFEEITLFQYQNVVI